ncbi:MAG TPA: glycosyl hydrolase, partial [Chitinophagaceae bacterium]|nr:glycosyl hydrolase [Chitinophagaceae bacterium]
IPETEGTDVLRFKFASSAANVTGKQLIASESATWLNEHFLSSLGDVKKAIDLYFLGGVNHIVYHGTAYSPKDVAWPGWLFYAAVHFQQTNPQWKDFHALNTYITRVQSFLQQGKPANDVLLYYPIADRYSQPGNVMLQHFDGMEKNFEKTDFEHVAKWMQEEGYGFDFFSDRQLKKFSFTNKQIFTGGNNYKAILLPANKLMDELSISKLLELASNGATILVYKELPKGPPGLSNTGKRTKMFNNILGQIVPTENGKLQVCGIGKGRFIISDDMKALMEAASVSKALVNENELSVIKRRIGNKAIYFVTNRTGQPVDKWITLSDPAKAAGLFDPMTGSKGMADYSITDNGLTQVRVRLDSFESVIVTALDYRSKEGNFPYKNLVDQPLELTGTWKVKFLEGGPQLPQPLELSKLESWTGFQDEVSKAFSGTALYTLVFDTPAGHTGDWLLNLGKVGVTAEVKLNGETIGTLTGPVFSIRLPAYKLQDRNKLEVTVANLMANRIAWMDRNDKPWKIFYNTNMPARKRENVKNNLFYAGNWAPLASGLMGPVTLTPLK